VLETPEAIFTALIVVDAVIAYSWMALLMALSSHQIGLNRWLGAEPAQQKKEVLAIPLHTPHRFGSVVGGIAFALFLTIVSLFYSAHLPTSVLVSSRNGWAILLVSTASLLSTLYKPIRHLGYSSSIMGQPALYIVLAAMGAQGNPTALWETPIWILLGLLTVAFHALWMLLGGKWLRIPLGILATASQANIGGVVSTPLVGAIYNQHLAAIGLLLALGCNAIGTYLGLISAALSRWLLGF
ncbi:DUF819 family protein, partial [Candidatus Uhrbacteria bacterium]|nr:DUF819 family protein [Candidatus Uhrbacteria bacterium]